MPKLPQFMKWLLLLLLLPVLACGAAMGDCACTSAVHHEPCPAFCACDHEAVLNGTHGHPCTHKPNPMVRVATATPAGHGHAVVQAAPQPHLHCRHTLCSHGCHQAAYRLAVVVPRLRPLRL